MNNNSTIVLILFFICFIANIGLMLKGYNELNVVTWVLLGFLLGSWRD